MIYWQFENMAPLPRSLEIGTAMAEASGYRLDTPEEFSSYAGFKDWFIMTFGRPGYTPECGLEKIRCRFRILTGYMSILRRCLPPRCRKPPSEEYKCRLRDNRHGRQGIKEKLRNSELFDIFTFLPFSFYPLRDSEPYLYLIGDGRRSKAFEGEGNAALLNFYKRIIRRAVIHIGGGAGKGGIGAHYNGIALHFVVVGILYGGHLGDGKAHALYGIAIGGGQGEVELKVFTQRQAADNKGRVSES